MGRRSLSASGLGIALIGFFLTRFTVTLAADESTVQFLFAGIVPLVLGLSLAAFGVVLTVGSYDRELVRTTALWCLLGTGTMAFLVVLTVLGTQQDVMDPAGIRARTYLSNFLIGGAVGGTLTGLYAARNREQRRKLEQQANRLTLLNRLLRDRVINAATAIKGHSNVLSERRNEDSIGVIDRQAGEVIDIVENVKYLSRTADSDEIALGSVDLVACLDEEIDAAREAHPEAEFDWSPPGTPIRVRANAQIREVFRHLFSNGVEYSEADSPRVSVSVDASPNDVVVAISDNGPGLPESQRALLERGEIAEFDDPTTGFGLNVVRLLVESFDGRIDTAVGDGTTVSIRLPRAGGNPLTSPSSTVTTPGVPPSRLALTIGAALFAGAVMTAATTLMGGSTPVIGALYGAADPVVGFITHEFHSVVFGLVYAGMLSAGPRRLTTGLKHRVGVAVGFGTALWLFAAGVIMPIWLGLVGIPASVPNLSVTALIGHLVWALVIAVSYHYGERVIEQVAVPDRISQFSPLGRTP
jgi:signal transduction histidine kinase/uncharacterized membrane protein YagU involved in acid resistance